MAEGSVTVRVSSTARDAINQLCVRAVPEINRMITVGEMISALAILGENHLPEIIQIMRSEK